VARFNAVGSWNAYHAPSTTVSGALRVDTVQTLTAALQNVRVAINFCYALNRITPRLNAQTMLLQLADFADDEYLTFQVKNCIVYSINGPVR
jgi:hypothetical protein